MANRKQLRRPELSPAHVRGSSNRSGSFELTDEVRELVARAQDGDREAFGALYQRYVGFIWSVLYGKCRNVALAEDLTTDTFIRGLVGLPRYRCVDKDPVAWFTTIANNLWYDHVKSGRHRLEVELFEYRQDEESTTFLFIQRPDNPETTVTDAAATAWRCDLVQRAMRRLPAQQRECLRLRFEEELSGQEAADKMGLTLGALKTLQYRAIRALGRSLAQINIEKGVDAAPLVC